ncbi:response regulator [Ramlibacter terrae]|uniref:Response regulator n=1 Tax=Ramlibacter terrae TaxID=2732511 RepID=A0ABX6P712_9BURK|nr:response regulator [Ramlibacter terrae]
MTFPSSTARAPSSSSTTIRTTRRCWRWSSPALAPAAVHAADGVHCAPAAGAALLGGRRTEPAAAHRALARGQAAHPADLGYWSKYTERYALSRVCVVDFSMPGMDGLQALAELGDWPGSRVLLTGQADEQVAVRAFNRGLIDQFIPKQTQDISRRLIEAVEKLLFDAHPRHAQTGA